MNLKLEAKILWPGKRVARRRLLWITLVVLSLVLMILALSDESRRHLLSWAMVSLAAITMMFLTSLLPTVHQTFNWLFSRRNIRRMLIGLAWLITIVALGYAEEDWRGSRAWNSYRQPLEAAGAQLDYRAFIPKPVPDDQNFAAIPLIESWFTQRTNADWRWADNYALADNMVNLPKNAVTRTGRNGNREFIDLVAWSEAFKAIQAGQTNSNHPVAPGKLDPASRAEVAPAVLAGLVSSETGLDQLRAASARPYARYPVVYDMDNPWGILLPHLGNIKKTVQRLQLRACAELAAGRSDEALADVKLMLYLADSVKDEPFLISYLVRLACVQLAVQPVWEGLAEQAWSDAQLQELQSCFQRYEFFSPMQWSLASERAAAILTADLLQRGKYHLNDLADDPNHTESSVANLFGRMVPHGWYDLEKLNYCRLFQLQINGAFDVEKRQVFPRQIQANTNALAQAFAGREPVTTICTRHQLLAVILLPALHNVPRRAAAVQTAADEAAIACTIERFRLAKGQYPDTLKELVPQFVSRLPNDVISGEPYKYYRTNDGRFLLYSVGWNEINDGGAPGQSLFDDKEGDWVWQYPAK